MENIGDCGEYLVILVEQSEESKWERDTDEDDGDEATVDWLTKQRNSSDR